jgi:ATP/maltotriose-dependent transcriptional regulator MalT
VEAALAALLNDVGGLPEDLLLILDDYHLIEAPEVHDGITFLLEYQPPQRRVVLASRADPPLPLARMLVALERANLFVVPLDDRRQWYRHHHLFADVLQAHLLDERLRAVAELHGRASAWFEANGDTSQAIGHTLKAPMSVAPPT